MKKFRSKILALLVVLLVGLLINGCIPEDTVPTEPEEQIIENISTNEAYELIQENEGNPDFVILDVRTQGEFESGYIENAINLDFYSGNFQDELGKLDKDKIYLVYCQSGGRSSSAVEMMKDMEFVEVYNMSGGFSSWKAEGLPVKEPEPPTPIIENISAKDAYELVQENQGNPNFVILDVRTQGEFESGHIENAINLNYYSENFDDELGKLDKNKIYVIYCQSGGRSGNALKKMEELGFMEVYNIIGGILSWEANGFPVV